MEGKPFSESDYLEMYPDVRAAVRSGAFQSGRHHFESCGRAEGRLGVAPYPEGAGQFFGEKPVEVEALGELHPHKFPYAGPYPWLDRDDWAERIAERSRSGELSAADAALCESWARHGYVIIKGCFPAETLDRAWQGYDEAIRSGVIRLDEEKAAPGDPHPTRFQDPHFQVPAFCEVMRHPEILRLVKLFMGREPAPFQTIASHKGTQQGPHSDSFHMTTYPLGYLTAAWVAFEDIHPDSGPLVYYPGSHRLPYVFGRDVGIPEGEFGRTGWKTYHERYEPSIMRLLAEHGLEPSYFLAGRGDVLIWHANLVHGGSLRRNLQLTRKALVCHYFVHGAVTYHDSSGGRAREHSGTCLLR
jgi:hypothetical protein